MEPRALRFANEQGEQLSGLLEQPEQPPVACALFAHCFTCNKDYKAPVWISRRLAELGLATLRFDFPGLGHSEGRFADTTLSKNVSDVISAARFLAQQLASPQILIGHSMGGAAVLRAAAGIDGARLTVCMASPAEPGAGAPMLRAARAQAERQGVAELRVGGQSLQLTRSFFDDLEARPLLDIVPELPTALMVFHAPADPVVPVADGERLFDAAPQPKSFVAMPGAGHLFDRQADARYVAETIAGWARQHCG